MYKIFKFIKYLLYNKQSYICYYYKYILNELKLYIIQGLIKIKNFIILKNYNNCLIKFFYIKKLYKI